MRVARAPSPRLTASVSSLLVAAVVAGAFAIGCGIRTPPRPPEDTMPRVASELTAEREAATITLKWRRPDKSADGQRLADLTGFFVERRSGDGAFTVVADVPADTTHRLRPFQHYSHVDASPPDGALEYRIVCYTADGQRSEPSASAFLSRGDIAP